MSAEQKLVSDNATSLVPLSIDGVKQAVAAELETRRCAGTRFSYAEQRGGDESLYGLTGAVNILAALGLPLGDRQRRRVAAARILRYQGADGTFCGSDGPGHALHMVVGALNLLGESIPATIAPLAPTDPAQLSAWLDRHDWASTHKELCGQAMPLLAGGRIGPEWVATFVHDVAARLDPARPLETWCAANDPPWRVISCLYHVLVAFDAGGLPYPEPELLLARLFGLSWDQVPDSEMRTVCTDGDWAWLLLRLCEQRPKYFPAAMAAIRRVSARRVRQWGEQPEQILAASTHHIYCHLWVTGLFQSCVRDHYAGGRLRDTLNEWSLYRW